MKMKRLFAGLTAAATLLGSMAFGAVAANADEGTDTGDSGTTGAVQACTVGDDWKTNTTITLNATSRDQLLKEKGSDKGWSAADKPRDYQVVKLADYVPDDAGNLALRTDSRVLKIVQAALVASGAENVEQSGLDPMQWVGQYLASDNSSNPAAADGTVRKFVDELTSDEDKYPLSAADPAGSALDPNGYASLTLTVDTPGLYLVLDGSGVKTFGDQTYYASRPMLVGTKVTALKDGKSCLDNADGMANVKTSPEGGFEFTKINRKGEALEGAKFVISKTLDDGTVVYGKYVDGKWGWARFYPNQNGGKPDPNSENDKPFIFSSGPDGKVQIPALPAGWYTITEVKAPDGYYGSDLPSFRIMVNKQGIVSSYIGEKDGDPHDLVQNRNGGVVVINVKFELPHTGAAGIAAFFAVAALLGGAGVTVFLKSRSTKRTLRA